MEEVPVKCNPFLQSGGSRARVVWVTYTADTTQDLLVDDRSSCPTCLASTILARRKATRTSTAVNKRATVTLSRLGKRAKRIKSNGDLNLHAGCRLVRHLGNRTGLIRQNAPVDRHRPRTGLSVGHGGTDLRALCYRTFRRTFPAWSAKPRTPYIVSTKRSASSLLRGCRTAFPISETHAMQGARVHRQPRQRRALDATSDSGLGT
jgi:hypothetical protein